MACSDELRGLILSRAPVSRLREVAVAAGMTTLRQSGLAKVREGITTLDEVLRETVT
jgi:type IV pilus assembly protein PilB